MRIVIALGGNALLKRGEPMTAEIQRNNVSKAAEALADVVRAGHEIIVAHGNGPQVGLLALQAAAYQAVPPFPLDVLGAESVGMIGYLVEQELTNALPPKTRLATVLTQVEVDAHDPAFKHPEKPIGPVYDAAEKDKMATAHGWTMVEESSGKWRRVVPSPRPRLIVQIEVIKILVGSGVVVICAGGGGIPVVKDRRGKLSGVEAVIDKDRAAALLASQVEADAFLMLTDVEAVYTNWGTDQQEAIREADPRGFNDMHFAAGSMGPKVEAACNFVSAGGGRRIAGIGRLEDALAILRGKAGTIIRDKAAAPR